MYPIKFWPIYKKRLWGGENWEICDHKADVSMVRNGRFAGKTLREILALHRNEILGCKQDVNRFFPLLLKVIDAKDKLSVQVHPDDEYALRYEGETGKNEAWYVLKARDNAQIIYGLKEGISKAAVAAGIEASTVMDLVQTVSVKAGDMIYIPAGTVHALLGGVVVYEVQQSADVTYRIYDYDRIGADGSKRELHIEKAMDVIHFGRSDANFDRNFIEFLNGKIERVDIKNCCRQHTNDHFIIFYVVAGNGKLEYGRQDIETLEAGETVLLPACMGEFIIKGQFTLLKIT